MLHPLNLNSCYCCSVTTTVVSDSLWPRVLPHLDSLSLTISQRLLNLMSIELVIPCNHPILCHPLSSCPQTCPASGSFLMSWLFTSSCQSIGASALASVVLMNNQDWSPLDQSWTGWISLQSEGLSRVFSSTTVQKHQFFSSQPSLWPNSHIHTWPLEKL